MQPNNLTPIFTFRGHTKPTTALACYSQEGCTYLVTGDQEGTLIRWNMKTFRQVSKHQGLANSQVQALKIIRLSSNVIFVHSRNDGVKLFVCDKQDLILLTHFRSCDSLFSRGDAISAPDERGIIAYPSELESHLVTIRIIDPRGKTIISGCAQRSNAHSVFDISILDSRNGSYYLYVGYEDGNICIFTFSEVSTKTIKALNTVGLKLDLVKRYDLECCDFVGALDIRLNEDGIIDMVCGSPKNDLIFVNHAIDSNRFDLKASMTVKLKKPGVSAIAIRPDNRFVAVALWGQNVDLYSMQTGEFIVSLKHHSKQVQSLLFIEIDDKYLLCCASMEGTVSIISIY